MHLYCLQDSHVLEMTFLDFSYCIVSLGFKYKNVISESELKRLLIIVLT